MPDNKDKINTKQNSRPSKFHQDGVEHRSVNFTLQSSGTQPIDDNRMRGKPRNTQIHGSDDKSKESE